MRRAAVAIAILAAGPATALTCLAPTVADSFQRADDRPEEFLVALGSLRRIGPDIPDGPDSGDPNMAVGYSFAAHFDGRVANSDAFVVDRQFDVTVEVRCVSAWCGGDSLGDYGLYFFRRDGAGAYALEAGPCGGFFFDNPVEHQLMEVIGMMP